VIGGLIVTHGKLADELLFAARMIEGSITEVEAVSLDWSESVEDSREKIRGALEKMAGHDGVIIFTDMFGGTPSNISLSFFEKDKIEILTGVNLPMIVKFGSLKDEGESLATVAQMIREKGAKSIRVASDVLVSDRPEPGV
jgi:mannose PTS system EIIA component